MALIIGLAITAPHFHWLYENDFAPFEYFASRSTGGKLSGIWRHLAYPVKFIAAQIMFCAAGLITYFSFYAKNRFIQTKNEKTTFKNILQIERGRERSTLLFIVISAIAPILLFALISFISGNALKSMWGFPCLYMFGIAMFYFLPLQLNRKQSRAFIFVMFLWSFVFAVVYTVQCLLTKSNRFTSNCPQIVQMLEQKWHRQLPNNELKYIAGSEWFVNMVNLYSQDDIKPMLWLSPKNNPWLDKDDFETNGALVVSEDIGAYHKMGKKYPISEPFKITLQYKNYFAKTKEKDLYYGFYLPEEKRNVR